MRWAVRKPEESHLARDLDGTNQESVDTQNVELYGKSIPSPMAFIVVPLLISSIDPSSSSEHASAPDFQLRPRSQTALMPPSSSITTEPTTAPTAPTAPCLTRSFLSLKSQPSSVAKT